MAGLDCDAGYDPRSPSALQYLPVVSSLTHGGSRATLEAILRVDALRQREARVRAAVRAWPLDRLEAAKVVTGALIARWTRERLRLEGSLQTDLARAPAADGAVLLPAVHASASGCPELTADVWERSSSMMNVVARQAGVSYLHAIQPNQYVADTKRLSSDELALAWSPQLPAAQAARVGYPHLLRRVPQMRAAGIDVVDLTGLFGDVAETVYVDQCCHLNYRGNRLLFEGVLTAMARSAEETPGEAGARLRPDTSQ